MSEKEVASKYAKEKLLNLHKEIEFLQQKLDITESLCQNKLKKESIGIRRRIQEMIENCTFLENSALLKIQTAKQFQLENVEKVRRTLGNFIMKLNAAVYGEMSELHSEWNNLHDILSSELRNCGILELKENSSQISQYIRVLSSAQLLQAQYTISPMSIPANVVDNSNSVISSGVSGNATIHTMTSNLSHENSDNFDLASPDTLLKPPGDFETLPNPILQTSSRKSSYSSDLELELGASSNKRLRNSSPRILPFGRGMLHNRIEERLRQSYKPSFSQTGRQTTENISSGSDENWGILDQKPANMNRHAQSLLTGTTEIDLSSDEWQMNVDATPENKDLSTLPTIHIELSSLMKSEQDSTDPLILAGFQDPAADSGDTTGFWSVLGQEENDIEMESLLEEELMSANSDNIQSNSRSLTVIPEVEEDWDNPQLVNVEVAVNPSRAFQPHNQPNVGVIHGTIDMVGKTNFSNIFDS